MARKRGMQYIPYDYEAAYKRFRRGERNTFLPHVGDNTYH